MNRLLSTFGILGIGTVLAACFPDPSTFPDPLAGAKPPPEKVTPDIPVKNSMNCELKNGPTGCVMSNGLPDTTKGFNSAAEARAAKAEEDAKAKKAAAAKPASFSAADCEKQGFAAVGMVNALFYSGQLGKFQEFCRSLESTAPPAAKQAAVSDTGSREGTWYCDNHTGSGAYGTWEMTQHPEQFDIPTCRRVQ